MKNWTRDIAGWPCPWRQDYQDAKRVAVQLGIELKIFDFQKQYKQKVVDYMIAEYKAGRTPNPDIMCNQEIKFKLFLETALEEGADLIATGHYARLKPLPASPATNATRTDPVAELRMAKDKNKDQTYFLYRVTEEALGKTLFPIGGFRSKEEVRDAAKKFGLVTADKPDSQGICFVGEVGIEEFIREFISVKPGKIIDQKGKEIGKHAGAPLYTIGQRHGLNIGGGMPYYVTGVDTKKNIVYVTNDIESEDLWSSEIKISDLHWINHPPEKGKQYQVRTRHRGELIDCTIELGKYAATIKLAEEARALTPGQSAVVYDRGTVVGGGVIV